MEQLSVFKKSISTYIDLIFKTGPILIILSTFFLFTNLTAEIYDTPKFLALLVFTGIMLILLMLKFTLLGKVVIIRTALDIPLLLLLAVAIVSTFLSPSPYISLLGNQLKINNSLVSLVALVLFYFLMVNTIKGIKDIKWIFNIAIYASQILAIITLLAFSGVKILPPPWTHDLNFTPTGSSFSTTAILALILPLIVIRLFSATKPVFLLLNSLFLFISGVTIALTGVWATWTGAVIGLILALFISDLSHLKNLRKINLLHLISFIAPLVLIAMTAILSFLPPVGNVQNPVYSQARNFPREIQLSFLPSWKISISAFRDSPFWGTGPATYLFDFTSYKPVELNSSSLWNLRFDSSFNEYLQVLATLGGMGLLALISLTVLLLSAASSVILAKSPRQLHPESYRLDSSVVHDFVESPVSDNEKISLAISSIIFFVILALHTATLPFWIIGILILASFIVLNLPENLHQSLANTNKSVKNTFLQIAANVTSHSSKETIKVDALPGILLFTSVLLTFLVFFFGGKLVLADYHHRLALNALSKNQGLLAYNELVEAEKLNPKNDVYRIVLAQTNFALANALAAAKAPSESSPAGSLTDADKQNIQTLLSQSITEARIATTLSPKSAINWEVLALLYRQISGVAQNALLFSLDAYGRAILQDPLNPQLRINVGGVYYAVKNYDLAIRFFSDAINLKPDFANAYYNLSVTLRDKGDLNGAQATAEKLLTLLPAQSAEYQTATDYLTDLKARIASGSAKEDQIIPPAAEENSALQKKQLPKVINLPKPEKIATPEAIEQPREIPAFSPNPTTAP